MARDNANVREDRGIIPSIGSTSSVSDIPVEPVGAQKITQPLSQQAIVDFSKIPTWAAAEESAVQQMANLSPEEKKAMGVLAPSAPVVASTGAEEFRNTLAKFFGPEALKGDWVSSLYSKVSGYYKTGSNIDDSFNLALADAETDPSLQPFKDRFSGIFDLRKLKNQGQDVYVPTISEYVSIQKQMNDALRKSGLADLANTQFTGKLIGMAKDAPEVGEIINNVFDVIDNADPWLKQSFSQYYPTLTRTDLAKALLTGDATGAQLQQKLKGAQVTAAAAQQGLVSTDPFAIAKQGISYGAAQAAYNKIAQALPGTQAITTRFAGEKAAAGVISDLEKQQMDLAGSAAATKSLLSNVQKEENLFQGTSGIDKSSLAQATQGNI